MSTKNNGGWNSLNEDKFNQFETSCRRVEADEKHGFGRLTDDCASIHLKSDLLKLAASDSPDAVAMLREAGIESPHAHRPFHLSDGTVGEIFADANGTWHARVTIAGETLDFAGEDRDGVMMSAERYARKNREPRALSESERYRIAALAQANISQAIIEYLRCRLGEEALQSDDRDPRHLHVYDQCAYDIFCWYENSYIPDPAFEQLLAQVAAKKPLNVKMVQVLYNKYMKEKITLSARQAPHEAQESEPVVTDQDLERLSDSEVAALHLGVARNRAREVARLDRETLGT